MGLFDGPPDPTLAELLRAVALAEPLEKTAEKLGIPRARVLRLLRTHAENLDPTSVPGPAGAAPKPTTPQLPSSESWRADYVAPPEDAAGTTPPPTTTRSPGAATIEIVVPGPHPRLQLYFDGASRGNPGPAGAGVVLLDPASRVVARAGKFLGVQTNNVAEYTGCIVGLETALAVEAKELSIRADSLLVINQLKGEWKIKNEGLRPLFEKARGLLRKFDRVDLAHVPREKNGLADEMSNRAIDERM